MVDKAMKDKTRKASSPSGSVSDRLVTHVANQVVHEGILPNSRCSSIIVDWYKGKDDALDGTNSRRSSDESYGADHSPTN